MPLKRKEQFKEEDLYEPVRKFLVNEGYTVQAEVIHCDIVAQKDDAIHILELKKGFTLKLVYQCLERQKIGDYVYAVIPIPKRGYSKMLKSAKNLLSKLDIGLIVVHLYARNSLVEILLEPQKVKGRKNARKKSKVIKEIGKRSGNYNLGGKKGKIISAYREASIHVYLLLQKRVAASAAEIVKDGGPKNASAILRDNHYGWFHKISRGQFTFDVDRSVLEADYQEIIDYFEQS